MADKLQFLYINYLKTQFSMAAVNICQQPVEDNALCQTTAGGNLLFKSISRESKGIHTPNKSRQDDENMPAKDSADKKYIFVTSIFRIMTMHPNGQNNTQAKSVKTRISPDNHQGKSKKEL